MSKLFHTILTLVVIFTCCFLILFILDNVLTTEAEQYSINMEITHTEQNTYYIHNSGSRAIQTFYLRGDNITTSLEVDKNTYALYKEGDWVEVEFTIRKSFILHRNIEEIRILGAMIEN